MRYVVMQSGHYGFTVGQVVERLQDGRYHGRATRDLRADWYRSFHMPGCIAMVIGDSERVLPLTLIE
jgi:hypothetical protein